MINTREELIKSALMIKDPYERVKFVMDFFLNTVEYEYGHLMFHGHSNTDDMQVFVCNEGSDSKFKHEDMVVEVEGKYIIKCNKCMDIKIVKGSSSIYNDIVELENSCDGDIEIFREKLKVLFKKEFSTMLENESLIESESSLLANKFCNDLNDVYSVRDFEDVYYGFVNDASSLALLYMCEKKLGFDFEIETTRVFPPKIEDGLLKRGICRDYTLYLIDLFNELGLEAYYVSGFSEFNHAWIAVKIDKELKFIDLTRAIVIRDGVMGIPKEQQPSDWLLSDLEDEFAMQPGRKVFGFGLDENKESILLPHVIDAQNYNKEEFLSLTGDIISR